MPVSLIRSSRRNQVFGHYETQCSVFPVREATLRTRWATTQLAAFALRCECGTKLLRTTVGLCTVSALAYVLSHRPRMPMSTPRYRLGCSPFAAIEQLHMPASVMGIVAFPRRYFAVIQ